VHRALLLALCALGTPALVHAQSSQFGVRGLGFPGRSTSIQSMGSGGSFSSFDPASSTNPAALTQARAFTASFTVLQNYRSSRIGDLRESGRDTRFPQVAIGGPIGGTPLAFGVSFSSLTDRDFELASTTSVPIRGVPVEVHDTLASTGGISDLRVAAAYATRGWNFGAGVHVITGSNRVELHRVFTDSAYAPVRQRSEISYAGAGVSAGIWRAFGERLALAGMLRIDGEASVDRDSGRVAEVRLPLTFGGAVRWRAATNLAVGAQAIVRQWSRADEALRNLGGTGAQDAVDLSAGIELTRNARRVQDRPIRFGARFATLPFPVESGARVREFGLSLGTGLRFAQDRAGIDHAGVDLSVERVWRGARGGFRESAWLIGLGITVRP
jgi:hypothetical protein